MCIYTTQEKEEDLRIHTLVREALDKFVFDYGITLTVQPELVDKITRNNLTWVRLTHQQLTPAVITEALAFAAEKGATSEQARFVVLRHLIRTTTPAGLSPECQQALGGVA